MKGCHRYALIGGQSTAIQLTRCATNMNSSQAPVLSTPATHIFENHTAGSSGDNISSSASDDEIVIRYEGERTLAEIRRARYTRVALQFPDSLLPDAPRVFEALRSGLGRFSFIPNLERGTPETSDSEPAGVDRLHVSSDELSPIKFYILADTSYGSCCVDEVAAEHVNADVVIHYGRACLSPTSRIPVFHVFTIQPLDHQILVKNFLHIYTDVRQKLMLMADVTYQSHLGQILETLEKNGYTNLFKTDILHNPSSAIPNRTLPQEVLADPSKLDEWHIFHVSDPPESLLLTLASRVASIRIFPTSNSITNGMHDTHLASTSRALNKRYALLTSAATVPIFGILINTLSVKNHLDILEYVKSQIGAAGKKSYTFVVGKLNAAKVANFSEIGAWVVIGCWESSLIDSKDFWRPLLTPFELELALKGDVERVWTGAWSSDFQHLLDKPQPDGDKSEIAIEREHGHDLPGYEHRDLDNDDGDFGSEPESTPPDFDLRTGKYVSQGRPLQPVTKIQNGAVTYDRSLVKRVKGEMAIIGGEASPGAEYLRTARTWKGLGSDFEIAYEEPGAAMEEGRSGIARGYTHAEDSART